MQISSLQVPQKRELLADGSSVNCKHARLVSLIRAQRVRGQAWLLPETIFYIVVECSLDLSIRGCHDVSTAKWLALCGRDVVDCSIWPRLHAF